MKIKRKSFIINFLLSLTILVTGFISPVMYTQAKEILTFEDEREISD